MNRFILVSCLVSLACVFYTVDAQTSCGFVQDCVRRQFCRDPINTVCENGLCFCRQFTGSRFQPNIYNPNDPNSFNPNNPNLNNPNAFNPNNPNFNNPNAFNTNNQNPNNPNAFNPNNPNPNNPNQPILPQDVNTCVDDLQCQTRCTNNVACCDAQRRCQCVGQCYPEPLSGK